MWLTSKFNWINVFSRHYVEHIPLPGLLFNQGNKFSNKIFQPINVNNAVLNNALGAEDREGNERTFSPKIKFAAYNQVNILFFIVISQKKGQFNVINSI